MESVIYQATVKTDLKTETYVGLTANSFKARWHGHKGSFKFENRKKETTLSKYIWECKTDKIPYTISWKILARAQPFSPVSGVCQLCTREKFFIAYKSEICSLNSRNEILNSCRHKQTCLLSKTKKKTKKLKSPGR